MFLKQEEMTTEQKLGMLFCARKFTTEEDIEFTIELIKKHALGCVQLPAHRPEVVERVLAEADYPIIVVNDAEMGFPTSELPKIPPIALAACNNKEYYRAFARGIVRDAQAAGFNGTWGPVIDILRKDGPCSVSRKFGNTPEKVIEVTEEIAKIFKQNHYLSDGKHYPGGGSDFPLDSHMVEQISSITKEELMEYDLKPYFELDKKGLLPSIMTRHCVFPNIDPDYPASLSKKVIDIIRDYGYDGLIFTDSIAMMGILQKYGEQHAYGLAIYAGNDIILPNYRTPVKEAFEMLVKEYENGAFSEERLNEAVRHVLAAQEFVGTKPENPTVFTEEDEQLLHDVARDCITAITDEGYSAALTGDDKDRLFVITEALENTGGGKGEIDIADWYDAKALAEKIKQEFPESGIVFIPEYSSQGDNDRVLNTATKYKEVVLVTYCTTTSYLGTDCLTRRFEAVANSLIYSGKVSTVLHFGNPFAIKPLFHVPRKVFGYIMTESQNHAIDVLKGTIEAKGKLPMDIQYQ